MLNPILETRERLMRRRHDGSGALGRLTGREVFLPRLGPIGFVMMMSLPRRLPQFANGTEDQDRNWGR